ncbi:MAG: hypothetical protein ACFFCV_19455 [Promethearchaeota archaeon]
MSKNTALFKIGGKILDDFDNLSCTLSQLTQLFKEGLFKRIILIPGGGSFANFIRKAYSELKFTEEIAHWMGIISMNYNGLELNKKFPSLQITENFEKLKENNKMFCIFLPYEYIKDNDRLPHSWDVTSDSISLFIAKELNLEECYFIKDVDGIMDNKNNVIKEISASELRKMKEVGKLAQFKLDTRKIKERSTPIDPYATNLINTYKISCIILNGSQNTVRIINYFKSEKIEERIYTIIK